VPRPLQHTNDAIDRRPDPRADGRFDFSAGFGRVYFPCRRQRQISPARISATGLIGSHFLPGVLMGCRSAIAVPLTFFSLLGNRNSLATFQIPAPVEHEILSVLGEDVARLYQSYAPPVSHRNRPASRRKL